MKHRHLLHVGSLALVLAAPAQALDDVTPAPRPLAERAGPIDMPADMQGIGRSGQARGAEIRQAVRCYQRGVRILDEELSGVLPDIQLRANTLLLRQASGHRLAIVTAGEGLCVLTLAPDAPSSRAATTSR